MRTDLHRYFVWHETHLCTWSIRLLQHSLAMATINIDIRYYMQKDGEARAGDLMIDFKDYVLADSFARGKLATRVSTYPKTPGRVFIKCPTAPLYIRSKSSGMELCFVDDEAVRNWRKALLISRAEVTEGKRYVFLKYAWTLEELRARIGVPLDRNKHETQHVEMGYAQRSAPAAPPYPKKKASVVVIKT
jgi:hypothetical protein